MAAPRILIVDDEPKLVRLAREILSATGFEVLTAGEGRRAIELVALEQPDLMLLDIMLPGGMDGYQIAERVRAFSNIPIIMLTARGEQIDVLQGFDAGADNLVATFSNDVLGPVAKELLGLFIPENNALRSVAD